jgi:parallel beta-helix repeat protein
MKKALIGIAVAAGLVLAAPAGAAVREVPQDFPTIQDAVDAANPGDTIAISKKRNNEGVDVLTGNLLIKGTEPGVLIDSYDNTTGDDFSFDIAADGVRILNLTLRNGYGIDCGTNDRCVAKKVRFSGQINNECFSSTGDDAKVIRSVARNCGSGAAISITGDDARVQGTTVLRSTNACIDISGADARVVGNRITGCDGGDGIDVSGGDHALIQGNSVALPQEFGIDVSGVGSRVLGNRVRGGDDYCFDISGDRTRTKNNVGRSCGSDGMDVSGENFKAIGNRIISAYDYGFYFSCSLECNDVEVTDNVLGGEVEDDYGIYFSLSSAEGLLVARNVVQTSTDYGLYFSSADNSRLVENVIRNAGSESEDAMYVSGDGNTLIGNRVLSGGGDGFSLSGADLRLEDNLARGNGGDGFYTSTDADNVLLRNRALANGGDGFENNGTDTVLRKNRASGNHRDCANDGTIAVKQGNKCADGSNFNLPSTASRIGR